MTNPHLTPLGNFVRPRRAQKGISLGQMAKSMNMTSAALSEYEIHKSPFPAAWVEPIATILELNEIEREGLRALRDTEVLARSNEKNGEPEDGFLGDYARYRHLLTTEQVRQLQELLLEFVVAKDTLGSGSNA